MRQMRVTLMYIVGIKNAGWSKPTNSTEDRTKNMKIKYVLISHLLEAYGSTKHFCEEDVSTHCEQDLNTHCPLHTLDKMKEKSIA